MEQEEKFYKLMREVHAEKMIEIHMATCFSNDEEIHKAYLDFRCWCRCMDYDPYTDSYELFKAYISSDTGHAYKGEGWKLFVPSQEVTPQMAVMNKQRIKRLIDSENEKVLRARMNKLEVV